jgi:hypothetical protein
VIGWVFTNLQRVVVIYFLSFFNPVQMEPTKEQKQAEEYSEDAFPVNKIELINQNIANNDPSTIHSKIEKYEELDSEQR